MKRSRSRPFSSDRICSFDTVEGPDHAFLYANGMMKDLGTFPGSKSDSSMALAINDKGQIVGEAGIANAWGWHACMWERGKIIDLGTMGGGFSSARAINNHGMIVGDAHIASEDSHAFLWQDGTMRDLGTLGGKDSYANAINDRGEVVGASSVKPQDVNRPHAFLWEAGKMKDLGTLGKDASEAYSINSRGQIVGWKGTVVERRAFVFRGGQMYDLNRLIPAHSGWLLEEARSVNESGQIVGYGRHNRQQRAFLLTPTSE